MSVTSVPGHFALRVDRDVESVVIVHLEGEFDIACEDYFEAAVQPLEEQGATIVIDLSGLTFIDSTGLRMLIAAHRRAHRAGAQLAVVPGDANVRRTLALTGLDQILPMVEGETDPATEPNPKAILAPRRGVEQSGSSSGS